MNHFERQKETETDRLQKDIENDRQTDREG